MTVLSERWTTTDERGITRFKLVTTSQPFYADVEQSQIRIGYDPEGYGGPYRIVSSEDKASGQWTTTWQCAESCD